MGNTEDVHSPQSGLNTCFLFTSSLSDSLPWLLNHLSISLAWALRIAISEYCLAGETSANRVKGNKITDPILGAQVSLQLVHLGHLFICPENQFRNAIFNLPTYASLFMLCVDTERFSLKLRSFCEAAKEQCASVHHMLLKVLPCKADIWNCLENRWGQRVPDISVIEYLNQSAS